MNEEERDRKTRSMIEAACRGIERLEASSSEQMPQIYKETMRDIQSAGHGEEASAIKESKGTTVSEKLAIKVLIDSLSHKFNEQARERFPTFFAYWEMKGEDIDNTTVKKLKDDYSQIHELVRSGLELGIVQGSDFIYIRAFEGQGTLSPHAPLMARQIIRPTVEYNARARLESMINQTLSVCNEAIRKDCGFGIYTK